MTRWSAPKVAVRGAKSRDGGAGDANLLEQRNSRQNCLKGGVHFLAAAFFPEINAAEIPYGQKSEIVVFHFEPSAAQASEFDHAMHAALASSVLSVATQAEPYLQETSIAAVSEWSETVCAGRCVGPYTFGGYYDLVAALAQDEIQRAELIFKELLSADTAHSPTRVRTLDSDLSRSVGERYQRFMGNGKTDASGIAPPRLEAVERFEPLLQDAFALLRRYRPTLHAEFETLIRDIILVAPDGSSPEAFEGGTCFKLWGALFLNAQCRPSPAQLAVSLAHEEGHAVLFGACRDEMLVENTDGERFWSPIRQAKRPMEGIFHATFVSARMIDLLLVLRQASLLSDYEKTQMNSELEQTVRVYEEGVSTIKRHARLTATGRSVLQAMRHAMDQRLTAV